MVSETRFTQWNKDRWTNVTYISKSKHKTTHFIGNTRKQCMNNINRHNTLKLAQIIKLVQYHIEGDQGLNHCSYMLMNSTVNDFIWETPDHSKNSYCTWVYCTVLSSLFGSHYHWRYRNHRRMIKICFITIIKRGTCRGWIYCIQGYFFRTSTHVNSFIPS